MSRLNEVVDTPAAVRPQRVTGGRDYGACDHLGPRRGEGSSGLEFPLAVRPVARQGVDVVHLRPASAHDAAFLQRMLVCAAEWRPDSTPRSLEEVLADPALAHYVANWPQLGDFGVIAEAAKGGSSAQPGVALSPRPPGLWVRLSGGPGTFHRRHQGGSRPWNRPSVDRGAHRGGTAAWHRPAEPQRRVGQLRHAALRRCRIQRGSRSRRSGDHAP